MLSHIHFFVTLAQKFSNDGICLTGTCTHKVRAKQAREKEEASDTNLCINFSFWHNGWNIQYLFHKCNMYMFCVWYLNEQVISWFLIYFIQYLYINIDLHKIWNCNFEMIQRWAWIKWPRNTKVCVPYMYTICTRFIHSFVGGVLKMPECVYI